MLSEGCCMGKRTHHLRLVVCDAAPVAVDDTPRFATGRRKKLPPLRPDRASAAIRASLRRLFSAQASVIDHCVAKTSSDGSAAVKMLEDQQRAIAVHIAELRESLRREHNGMRWKKGMSWDEN